MNTKKISQSEVRLGEEELEAVQQVLRSGNLREGRKTREFEEAFCRRTGATHAVAASSGTTALHLTYLSLLKPGDEVLVPSFTFIATASMVVQAGARPVFCDIDPETWTIDPQGLEGKITPKTKAIAGVHLFGNSCAVTPLREIAQKRKLLLIWDAAQAFGTRYEGLDLGQIPDAVCFSFYPTKNMTTGEGGMVTTASDGLAQKIRLLKSHGQSEKYLHTAIGFNYRMTEMAAAIGLEQLKKLDSFLKRRKEIAKIYTESFSKTPQIQIQKVTPGAEASYNYFCIATPSPFPSPLRGEGKGEGGRDDLVAALRGEGIECAVHYPRPLHQQPCFAGFASGSLPESERLSGRILALPMHPFLSGEDARTVAEKVKSLVSRFSKKLVPASNE